MAPSNISTSDSQDQDQNQVRGDANATRNGSEVGLTSSLRAQPPPSLFRADLPFGLSSARFHRDRNPRSSSVGEIEGSSSLSPRRSHRANHQIRLPSTNQTHSLIGSLPPQPYFPSPPRLQSLSRPLPPLLLPLHHHHSSLSLRHLLRSRERSLRRRGREEAMGTRRGTLHRDRRPTSSGLPSFPFRRLPRLS
ncbi:hypothetical protein BDY24DRAFT_29684 [Mrakia frigida]|uniref:uncharacterized protein n=1 Tax=Mrakia frigida TaxID=29902 RepID=UPI003FCBF8DB